MPYFLLGLFQNLFSNAFSKYNGAKSGNKSSEKPKDIVEEIKEAVEEQFNQQYGDTPSYLTEMPEVAENEIQTGNAIEDSIAKQTGSRLTTAEQQANAFNRSERLASQAFTHNEAVQARLYQNAFEHDKYALNTSGMLDAGLNPALMYGGGSLVSTNATGAMGSSSPARSVQPSNGGDIFQTLMSLIRMPLELKQLNAEINKTQVETTNIETGTTKIIEEINQIRKNIDNIDVDIATKNKALEYADLMYNAQLRVYEATADEKEAGIQQIFAAINRMDFQNLESLGKYVESMEHVNVMVTEQGYNKQAIAKMAQEIENMKAQKKLLDQEFDDWDFLHTIGSNAGSFGLTIGPFKTQQSAERPVTLFDIKEAIRNREYELSKPRKKHSEPEFTNTD